MNPDLCPSFSRGLFRATDTDWSRKDLRCSRPFINLGIVPENGCGASQFEAISGHSYLDSRGAFGLNMNDVPVNAAGKMRPSLFGGVPFHENPISSRMIICVCNK